MSLKIGIDGGGSKTELILVDAEVERARKQGFERICSMRSRYFSPLPHRRMRRTNGADTCCRERSK